jgi:FtsH-binding integral membrane protein
MAQIDRNYQAATAARTGTATVDEGLRTHMLHVYNYLAAGIGIAGVVAYMIFSMSVTSDPALAVATMRNGVKLTAFGKSLFGSGLITVVQFAPLVILIGLMFVGNRMGVGATQAVYWVLVSTIGASLSSVFIIYQMGSVAQVFGITALSFAALSLWGYTTKRDLSGMGSFLFMGLVGIILAGLANMWFQSGAMQFVISVIGVLLFAGFTAYDTQRIKDEYFVLLGDAAAMSKAAVWGALSLFLDFVNMFQFLLSLLGNRN